MRTIRFGADKGEYDSLNSRNDNEIPHFKYSPILLNVQTGRIIFFQLESFVNEITIR